MTWSVHTRLCCNCNINSKCSHYLWNYCNCNGNMTWSVHTRRTPSLLHVPVSTSSPSPRWPPCSSAMDRISLTNTTKRSWLRSQNLIGYFYFSGKNITIATETWPEVCILDYVATATETLNASTICGTIAIATETIPNWHGKTIDGATQ